MPLFKRKKPAEEPIDLDARSEVSGLCHLFQGIADDLGGEFDGWEASLQP
jgi:hypothetical protein